MVVIFNSSSFGIQLVIHLHNIALQFHGDFLYQGVHLDLFPQQRVGLIGANGTGKSSLLKVITKDLLPDEGELNTATGLRFAIMHQTIPHHTQSALAFVMEGHHEYMALQKQLEKAYEEENNEDIIHILSKLDDLNAYHLEALAATILHGLGFTKHEIHQSVNSFSGGWRMRLQLAQALLKPSDVMLLDEPTNHLDIATISWLEKFLKSYEGALIVISHDRTFLDNIATHIWHIEQKAVKAYKGNYSDFERLRAEHIKAQQALSEKQQRAVAHMQQFVDRFRAKATKAKQAQSRLKALQKIEVIQIIQEKESFTFEFQAARDISNPALRTTPLTVGYDKQHPVLTLKETVINKGDRVGLLGVNGAGKSTLLKLLAGKLLPLSGEISYSPKLDVGYFAQDHVEQLHLNESPLWHMKEQHPQWPLQQIRNFLGSFQFPGDDVFKPLQQFSGGEQSRFMLALLAARHCNFLLLDEPTNHLDMEMRNALVLSLQEFTGSFLMVSHDRYLLESCCDEFWLVDRGQVKVFEGNMEDYEQWLLNRGKEEAPLSSKKSAPSLPPQEKQQLEKQIKTLESKMEKINGTLANIEEALQSPDLYTTSQHQHTIDSLLTDKKEQQKTLDALQDEWYALIETLENSTS